MKLDGYKRPPNDNGRGLMGPPRPGWDGGVEGLEVWIRELVALGIKWFHIVDDGGNSAPLCERLLDHAIFPIVRLIRRDAPPNDGPEPNPGHLNPREAEAVRKLVRSGVLYFETNVEPDLATSWKNRAQPSPRESAELIALNWLFDARIILEAGGYPGLPAVSCGRDLPLFEAIAELGRSDLLEAGCWIAVHNCCMNRPLEFPDDPVAKLGTPMTSDEYDHGGLTPWVWWNSVDSHMDSLEEVNARRQAELHPQALAQEHGCFREFEYYEALGLAHLSIALPVLSTGGGCTVGRRDDFRYARVTPQAQADRVASLFQFVQAEAPAYLFCGMGGRLTSGAQPEQDDWYGDFWARTLREGPSRTPGLPPVTAPIKVSIPLPVVSAVKALPKLARALPAPSAEPEPTTSLVMMPRPEAKETAAADMPWSEEQAPLPPSEKLYVVQEGETLIDVAEKFAVTVSSIIAANDIRSPNMDFAGRQLVVLLPHESAAAAARPRRPSHPPAQPPTSARLSGLDWDSRLDALHIVLERADTKSARSAWKLIRAEYLDTDPLAAEHAIYFMLLDESGAPVANQVVIQAQEGEVVEAKSDAEGQAVIPMWAGFSPDREERGAYSAHVKGSGSDRVTGLGLPTQILVSFRLIFQRTSH